MSQSNEYRKKLTELARLKEEKRLKDELPHLHKFKEYAWSREFIESKNRMNLVCASNQCGKSSSQIKKNIKFAIETEKWPERFPERTPTTFWYIYPDENKVNEEFDTKWKEFLPCGLAKDDPKTGWDVDRSKGKVVLKFNSGVSIYFKTWGTDNQSGTVDMVSCDEEVPEHLYPELSMRIARYNGIFNMVFTATLNQPFWFQAIERIGHSDENFPHASKWQVSIPRDCTVYEDGSPSPWTPEKIQSLIARCGTQKEVDRRVHGRFVTEEGTKYASFSRERNVKTRIDIPKDWIYFSGVDCGSGGHNHPAAISVIAVRPDFRYARLVRFWKGNKSERTTSDDILKKYIEVTKGIPFTAEYYDFGAVDFKIISDRHGFNFQKANKDRGEDVLNVLFKNQMLDLEEGPYLDELIIELMTLKENTAKTKAKDDGCFLGGSKVWTSTGERPIQSIKTGDLVWTRQGLKKVLSTSSHVDHVYQFTLPNQKVVHCTHDHKFFADGDFLPISSLTNKSELLEIKECLKQSYLMGLRFEDTQIQKDQTTETTTHQAGLISFAELNLYIEKFGKATLDLYQRVLTFITLMEIHLIILLKTFSALIGLSTYRNTQEFITQRIEAKPSNTLMQLGRSQKHGTIALRVKHFIRTMGAWCGRIAQPSCSHALSAPNNMMVILRSLTPSVPTIVNLNIDGFQVSTTLNNLVECAQNNSLKTDTQKQQRVPAPVRGNLKKVYIGKRPVYNITVEDAHEYFVNGVLVKNCDSLRYATSSVPWDIEEIKTDDLMKRLTASPKIHIPSNDVSERGKRPKHDPVNEWDLELEMDEWNNFGEF